MIKIGTHLGRNIYVSEAKLNKVAEMFPCSYLRCLEGVCEIIRHHSRAETKSENELVFESVFGSVGIKRDSIDAKWFVDWWGFNQMEDR